MSKGSGGTRGSSWRNNQSVVDNYLKAYTAKGGIDFSQFSSYFTKDNESKTIDYIEKVSKEKDISIYRGSYMLSGDIENNIVFGGWKEGKTIIQGKDIGTDNTFLSFSKDKNRVFSYVNNKPKPKSQYNSFENEAIRVRYSVRTTGKHFVDISKKSIYPEEKECIANKSKAKFKFLGAEYHDKGSFWDIRLEEI